MIVESKQVKLYVTQDGRTPYVSWIRRLDERTKNRIDARVTRLALGDFGKSRSVGKGVVELNLDFGPGYRVYLGQEGSNVIILLMWREINRLNSQILKMLTSIGRIIKPEQRKRRSQNG